MKKMATTALELAEESVLNEDRSIERDSPDCFLENAVAIARVKSVKTVAAREE